MKPTQAVATLFHDIGNYDRQEPALEYHHRYELTGEAPQWILSLRSLVYSGVQGEFGYVQFLMREALLSLSREFVSDGWHEFTADYDETDLLSWLVLCVDHRNFVREVEKPNSPGFFNTIREAQVEQYRQVFTIVYNFFAPSA